MNLIFAGVSLCKSCIVCYKRPYLASRCKSLRTPWTPWRSCSSRRSSMADSSVSPSPEAPSPRPFPSSSPTGPDLLSSGWISCTLFFFISFIFLLGAVNQLNSAAATFPGNDLYAPVGSIGSWLFRFSSSALAEDTFFFSSVQIGVRPFLVHDLF